VMVKVAEVVEVFPHSSDTVNVTVAEPVAPHKSDNVVKSLLHITFPQLSVAKAPPFEASHAVNWAVFPMPSQSTARLVA